jgi:Flp pilus assembly protein protease CpaA
MGAIGAWVGLKQGVIVLLCVASAGVVMALAKALKDRRLKSVLSNVSTSFYIFLLSVAGGRKPSLADAGGDIDVESPDRLEVPYGVAIAAGLVIAAAVVGLWGPEWLWSW